MPPPWAWAHQTAHPPSGFRLGLWFWSNLAKVAFYSLAAMVSKSKRHQGVSRRGGMGRPNNGHLSRVWGSSSAEFDANRPKGGIVRRTRLGQVTKPCNALDGFALAKRSRANMATVSRSH